MHEHWAWQSVQQALHDCSSSADSLSCQMFLLVAVQAGAGGVIWLTEGQAPSCSAATACSIILCRQVPVFRPSCLLSTQRLHTGCTLCVRLLAGNGAQLAAASAGSGVAHWSGSNQSCWASCLSKHPCILHNWLQLLLCAAWTNSMLTDLP